MTRDLGISFFFFFSFLFGWVGGGGGGGSYVRKSDECVRGIRNIKDIPFSFSVCMCQVAFCTFFFFFVKVLK